LIDGKGRKYFFFEKKKQKTFASFTTHQENPGAFLKEQKFFVSFFQKRRPSFLS
jgi:hypothetical protein